jgi:hypothetical protein
MPGFWQGGDVYPLVEGLRLWFWARRRPLDAGYDAANFSSARCATKNLEVAGVEINLDESCNSLILMKLRAYLSLPFICEVGRSWQKSAQTRMIYDRNLTGILSDHPRCMCGEVNGGAF